MKKVYILFVSGLLLLGISALAVGCGSSGSTTAATTTTVAATTTTTAASTTTTTSSVTTTTGSGSSASLVTISGSLNSGAIAGAASVFSTGKKVQAFATTVLNNYSVTAVGKSTGSTYYADATTDSSGNFTISNLPSDESYYLQIIDDQGQFAAPVAFGTLDNKTVMAVSGESQSGTISLGAIVYDSNKNCAAPSVEPTAILDPATKVGAKSGESLVPKGAGNFGKGSNTEIPQANLISTISDKDQDGIPNVYDADNNGDGILDEIDGEATKETLATASTKIEHSTIWTNVKVPYGQSVSDVVNNPTGYWIIMAVAPKSGYTITYVSAESGPSWMSNAKIHTGNGTDGNSDWSSVGYKLYNPSGSSESRYQVMLGGANIAPGSVVKSGDTFTFLVNFSDNSTERITKMINFAFGDIPRLKGYYSGRYTTTDQLTNEGLPAEDQPSNLMLSGNPFTTSEVSLKWQKPSDESGALLEGATYAWEVGDGNWVYPETTSEVGSPYVYGYADLASEVLLTAESFSCAIGMIDSIGDNAVQNCTFAKTTSWGATSLVEGNK